MHEVLDIYLVELVDAPGGGGGFGLLKYKADCQNGRLPVKRAHLLAVSNEDLTLGSHPCHGASAPIYLDGERTRNSVEPFSEEEAKSLFEAITLPLPESDLVHIVRR